MKICYVVAHFSPYVGGVENLFMEYAKGMLENGHEIRVITSNSGGIDGRSVQNGIDVYHYKWKIIFGHPLCKAGDLNEHIKWADIVHTTTFTPAIPSRKACIKLRKPCIITIHEVLGDKWYWIEKNKLIAFGFKCFEKYVCNKPYDYIHVISNATHEDYKKYCGERDGVYRIYNWVDDLMLELPSKSSLNIYSHFKIKENTQIFLFFGRPGQSKGIFVYLEAIKLLRDNNPAEILDNIKFCFIISHAPKKQREEFIKKIKDYNLSELIIISDPLPRSDLFKMVNDADYIVVPSITEGFGFSAAESCLFEKMLICSDGGSLPEVASGKVLFFKNRDSVDLSEKLTAVIEKKEEAFAHINKKDFSKEKMLSEITKLYNTAFSQYKNS